MADLVNLEFLGLSLHFIEEDRQIDWDLVVANEVMSVLTHIELLAQLLAHFVNLPDRLWVFKVRLFSILETD